MKYVTYRDFASSLLKLYQRGGKYQQAAEKVKTILGDISLYAGNTPTDQDPLKHIPRTQRGETRISNCVKYDLTGFCRLITIQEKDICILCFVGTHNDSDKWLAHNKNLILTPGKDDGIIPTHQYVPVQPRENESESRDNYPLYEILPARYIDKLEAAIPSTAIKYYLRTLTVDFSEKELYTVLKELEDAEKQKLLIDAFRALKEEDVQQAKNFIDIIYNLVQEERDPDDLNDYLADQKLISSDITQVFKQLEFYFHQAKWYEWMNYLHPDRKKYVDEDYAGPFRLLGVSGSGKTAIVVLRSLRLAQQYPGEAVLILSLNLSLVALIRELLQYADPEGIHSEHIKVMSMWELCRKELQRNVPALDPVMKERRDGYEAESHISETYMETIWRDFFYQKGPDSVGETLSVVIDYLHLWGVSHSEYIKQEFDWIRSAFNPDHRYEYLNADREGRKIPFNNPQRKLILLGLHQWEQHLADRNESDYFRLVSELLHYKNQIEPGYRCVLVDETQDLGTQELAIIRKLVKPQENDLFLAGDIAQKVYIKHQDFDTAGIEIVGRSQILKQNYRNSQEILQAAYQMLKRNLQSSEMDQLAEILTPPSLSDIQTGSPKVLKSSGKSVSDEIQDAIPYIEFRLYSMPQFKACIAIAGLNPLEVNEIANDFDLPMLDGEVRIGAHDIFISDLEQTKGLEFDLMVIVNCNRNAIPNPQLPYEERFKDASKLYVAMTRAKKELVLSYHNQLTSLLKGLEPYFSYGSWEEQTVLS